MRSSIEFRKIDHTYWLDGKRVPNVTSIIDGQLRDFSKVPNIILEQARELGTLVHETTAMDVAGNLDEESVDEDVEPYLRAWRLFLQDTRARVITTEERLHHPLYGYCGTCDHVILLNDVLTLIDKKSGQPDDADRIQTAAYIEMRNYGVRQAARVRRRAALYLRPTGRYALEYHNDKSDFPTFLSALTIHKRRVRDA
jgi:hypothetical protein